ncbi:hypothetical protein SKAU_G00235580 [Synaphobranchus kaupii]|uniref:ribonuclease H n=1 Tax=Synaphobranchus kaupii TaxID=118154 RepID=A0A9Q1F6F5_SYNKA|nr:hypothetical protein SKAU_G00235580 [Synaphobranchus kaupii]
MLFEPDDDSVWLEQVDLGGGLLEIKDPRRPYVTGPIGNNTKQHITLQRKTALGSIQPIAKVVETNSPTKAKVHSDVKVNSIATPPADGKQALWHLPVDTSHLDERQQEVVKKMLYEESAAFAQDSNDIRCIPDLQMSLYLKDDIPVQGAYSSVPKPLFKEVKEYIQDLSAKGLSNAPAAFQRSMEEMLGSLRDDCCIPYVDDVLCFARSFEEHVKAIRQVLKALQQHGVKLRV